MDTREHTKKLANDIRTKIYGKEVREALATGIEESGDTSQEARDITENLLDGSYDTGLLNTEIEQRMNNLYSTKGQAMDDLYTQKNTELTDLYINEKSELDNLQADYANRAEVLETTYAPRLTTAEQNITTNHQEVTAQLAQTEQEFENKVDLLESGKIDKSGSMQVSYGNLAQDVREAMTGDKVGVVGVESTGQTNLTQNAVTEFETTTIEKSKNLFNLNNLVKGHTLNVNTGGYIESPTISTNKDWIRVVPGEKLYKNFHGTWTFADESFNVLGGQGNVQPPGIIEIPSNAYFIKVSSRNSELDFAQLEYGEGETSFVIGDFRFKEGIKLTGHDLDRESVDFSRLTGLVTSSNLLNPRKIITGVYVRVSDGALLSASGNSTFENVYIPKNTETLRVHEFTSGAANYIFKNVEGNRISGGQLQTTSEKTLSVPPNAMFLTISFINSEIPQAMVSVGSQEKTYEPYYNYFEDILDPKSVSEAQEGSRLSGQVGVAFGDSLTGMYPDNVAYPNRVKDELGLEDYINVGFSGTRMSGGAPINHKDFSLPSLVDSVISGDYTLQNESVNLELGMYETHLDNLKNIDWLNVDFVSIFYGANDYSGGVGLDNEINAYDTTTFKGGLRYAIKELSTKYPHLKFIIITPSFIPTRENVENNAGLLTDDYVRGTIDVQEELSTGLVNLFHNGQINRFNYATYLQQDALHFNHSAGLERVSELISSQLLVYL